MRAREKSLKNFRLVPLRRRYVSPLSCRSCRHRSWSGWGGMEQRDGIVDLGAETGMKKHERGSDRLRSGSKPNSIGATHNHAIGRMTHSQGSNSVAQAPALMVSHARAIPGQFRFCRTKILRSSRGWRASTLAPISPEQQPAVERSCGYNHNNIAAGF